MSYGLHVIVVIHVSIGARGNKATDCLGITMSWHMINGLVQLIKVI